MAYVSEDKQEVVHIIKLTDFAEVRISSVSDKDDNLKAVDIRNWYCTQKDLEMKPTQKGVRIKVENLSEVINVLERFV